MDEKLLYKIALSIIPGIGGILARNIVAYVGSVEGVFSESLKSLQKIPGIGEINAAIILFELQDISRFKTFDNLASYVGLVPDTDDSGDTKKNKGLTHRRNIYLRDALIESSWVLIKKDPAMLMKYKDYCKRMHKNKAIVKIARHLLARINHVLKNKTPYVSGLLNG